MRTLVATLLAFAVPGAAADTLAIRGQTVYTMAGPPLRDGLVLVREGKIVQVGPAANAAIPADARRLEAPVVTPGLIDAHATVGLSGLLNQAQDQDQLDRSAPVQPELRALDAYNARDPLVDWVRSFGVTTVHTGHAPGATVSGQTMIVKTWPPNVEQAVVVPTAMIAATLGPAALNTNRNASPGTSAKAVALLRAELIKAAEYTRKRALPDTDKQPPRDLRMEALHGVLEGKTPLLLTAHRHLDILAGLRVAREFNLRLVLDGVADAPVVLNQIRESGFPVIVHPTMARAVADRRSLAMDTAARLKEAGIPFAFQSGFEAYVPKTRVALLEAAVAVSHGLEAEAALAALTIDAARLLGVAERLGSLAPGKDADLALYDGDPFEYTTHCIGVVVSGLTTDTLPR